MSNVQLGRRDEMIQFLLNSDQRGLLTFALDMNRACLAGKLDTRLRAEGNDTLAMLVRALTFADITSPLPPVEADPLPMLRAQCMRHTEGLDDRSLQMLMSVMVNDDGPFNAARFIGRADAGQLGVLLAHAKALHEVKKEK